MIRIIKRIAVVCLAMAAFISFHSCAHTDSSSMKSLQTEVWDMQITGDTVAQYKMLLNKKKLKETFIPLMENSPEWRMII
jgi:hypothetical protein